MPRKTSQAWWGSMVPPTCTSTRRIRVIRSAERVTSIPATTSEWPFRYLVMLCRTTSAPRSSGRWSTGLQNVLSTTRMAPALWAILAQAAMSLMARVGFPGVSR